MDDHYYSSPISPQNGIKILAKTIGVRAIFYQGGGEPFAQKILASYPNFYEKVEKKRESYTMLEHRPTYEVKIFLQMNLSYDLIKHVKRDSCLGHFDGQRHQ